MDQSRPVNHPTEGNEDAPPPRATLVAHLDKKGEPAEQNDSKVQVKPPVNQFICHLTEKGSTRKFYLSLTLEGVVTCDALLDTAADVTIMSTALFQRLRLIANQTNNDLETRPCSLKLRPFSHETITLTTVSLVQLSVGPMKLVHPVYVSPLDSIPFLVGKDLLNRFEPVIDFKRRKLWAQVRQPLTLTVNEPREARCYFVQTPAGETKEHPNLPRPHSIQHPDPKTRMVDEQPSPTPPKSAAAGRNEFLCSVNAPDADEPYCPLVANGIERHEHHATDVRRYLESDRSAANRELRNRLASQNPNMRSAQMSSQFPSDVGCNEVVKDHAHIPGLDRNLNDIESTIAKHSALRATPRLSDQAWLSVSLPPTPFAPVGAMTAATAADNNVTRPSDSPSVKPAFTDDDSRAHHYQDPAILFVVASLTDKPDAHTTPANICDVPDAPALPAVRPLLQMVTGILTCVSGTHPSPGLAVPRKQRGVMLMHAHDTPSVRHKGTEATQRVSLQQREISFPWSDVQINWMGPLTKSTQGNKNFLAVTRTSTKWIKRLPAANDTAETTAYILMNHVSFWFRLPNRVDPDRGTHCTADVMRHSHVEPQVGDEVWCYQPLQYTRHGTRPGKPTRKLLPRWTGPHMIIDTLSPVVSQIRLNRGRKDPLSRWVRRNQIELHQTPMGLAGDHTLTDSN